MAKKRPNKIERERLRTIGEMPCYACFQDGRETNAEVHHIRTQTGLGLRPSHFATIPLCSSHHRTGKLSVHLGKKAFERPEILPLVIANHSSNARYLAQARNLA